MPRPIWKGFISFGLVNIPVVLYSAENKSEIQFKMVDKRDHSRIRYNRINEETGRKVNWEDIGKGYEYDENHMIVVDEKELKAIAGENSKTINIEKFVLRSELDYSEFEKPYYLVPDKKGEKGYVILREILKETKKVGISKVIIHTKEYLAALIPHGNALMLDLMRYASEIRKPSEFEFPEEAIKKYKITPKEIDVAKQLVSAMTSKWKASDFKDDYRIALEKYIDEKIRRHKGHTKMKRRSEAPVKGDSNVIDFVSLMKESLKKKAVAAKSRTQSKKRIAVKAKSSSTKHRKAR